MVESFTVKIPSLTKDRERKAYVYLPVGYGEGESYPVLYMFDGQNLFDDGEATYGKSWGLADFLDYTETPLIVVGVECDTVGDRRLSEYCPFGFEYRGKRMAGRGKKYMDWLVGEFKPYIDQNYATLPDREHTGVGGSSMGGLMTLYALAAYGKYFSRGAALSPSLWIGGGKELPDFLKKAAFRRDTVLYMDYGEREFSNHFGNFSLFGEACSLLISKKVLLTCRVVPDGTHCEQSWERQIPFFINTLFYGADR